MWVKKYTYFSGVLLMAFLYLMPNKASFSQGNCTISSGTSLFNSGNFSGALSCFRKLIKLYPGSSMINYYLGASFIETEMFNDSAFHALNYASQAEGFEKSWYYLGLLHHKTKEWNMALLFYNRYRNFADKSDFTALKIDDKIQRCYAKKELDEPLADKPDLSQATDTSKNISQTGTLKNNQPVSSSEDINKKEIQSMNVWIESDIEKIKSDSDLLVQQKKIKKEEEIAKKKNIIADSLKTKNQFQDTLANIAENKIPIELPDSVEKIIAKEEIIQQEEYLNGKGKTLVGDNLNQKNQKMEVEIKDDQSVIRSEEIPSGQDTTKAVKIITNQVITQPEENKTSQTETLIAENKTSQVETQPEVNGTSKNTIQAETPRELFSFEVNENITYLWPEHFRTENGRQKFREGVNSELLLDSVLHKLNELRNQYQSSINPMERENIGNDIIILEQESMRLNQEIPRLFANARETENSYWKDKTREDVYYFMSEIDSIRRTEADHPASKTETGRISEKIDNQIIAEVLAESSRDRAEKDRSELVFKVLLGEYKGKIPFSANNLFNKLSMIRKIDQYTDENGITVYTTGNLTSLEDANEMQKQVRQEGIKEAKIIAFLDGKRITLQEAMDYLNQK